MHMHLYIHTYTYIHLHKCFQVLLFKTNNSIKHQSLFYARLNWQTVLFQTIQFSISHLFAKGLIPTDTV